VCRRFAAHRLHNENWKSAVAAHLTSPVSDYTSGFQSAPMKKLAFPGTLSLVLMCLTGRVKEKCSRPKTHCFQRQ
jgi:hypothetical protein